jgi:uncharacterized membrane protein YhiD involved in acid resistance
MDILQQLFGFQDLTGTFSVTDVVLGLTLSFVLTAMIGWVYQITHRGVSYTQSYVHTLVMMGVIVSVVMLIIGSNIARAFALVGALSIIRFRNAVKETRDVGFIFFAMAIGMATGTRFYLLAVIAAVLISLMILIMNGFNWYARQATGQLVKIQVPNSAGFDTLFDGIMARYASASELISVDSVHSGMLTELIYTIRSRRVPRQPSF